MELPRKLRTALQILRQRGIAGLAFYRGCLKREHFHVDEVLLAYSALKAGDSPGTMVDVGAHFGGSLAPFAKSNWRVLAFEPDPANRAKLVSVMGGRANVVIDDRAVSDKQMSNVPFFSSDISTGISGLSSFDRSHVQSGTVNATTLAVAYRHYKITSVDFLKIDAEGYDLFVLKGNPWDANRPRMIMCEFEDKKTVPLGYSFHDLAGYLVDQGYRVLVSEWYPLARYGTDGKWRRFVAYPAELKDKNAWGNLLATRDAEDQSTLLAAGSAMVSRA